MWYRGFIDNSKERLTEANGGQKTQPPPAEERLPKEKFLVIIAGGRYFSNYELLRAFVDVKLSRIAKEKQIEIVSGGATGADALGERYAKEKGYLLRRFPADWKQYGRAAGVRRNKEMAQNADALIAFWNGESRGTKNMIEEARAAGLLVAVKRYT